MFKATSQSRSARPWVPLCFVRPIELGPVMSGRYIRKIAVHTGVASVLMAIHLASAQSLPGILGRTSDGSCAKPGGWTPLCGSDSPLGHLAPNSSFDSAAARLSGGLGGGVAPGESPLAAIRARISGSQPMLPRRDSSGNSNRPGLGSIGGGSSSDSYLCLNGGCAEAESDEPVGVRLSERGHAGGRKRSAEFDTQGESGGTGASGY